MKLCSIDGESERRSNRLIKRQRCLGGSIVTCLSLFLSRSFECPFFSCPLFSHRVSDRESTGHQTWKRRVTASKICRVKGERSMVVSTRERNEDREGEREIFKFLSRGLGRRFETKLDGSENKSGSLRCSGRRIRRRANFNWFSNPND